jgi:DNA repair exonuclease SbcCD ATPase subunit
VIYFKAIRWKNLLSTGNEFTEIVLDKSQTTLIVGENGAGKSTFLEALTFSLFGKPFRKVNKPQLVNSMNRKNMVVEVEFSIGPNFYKIVRGLKPNIFEIYQNGSLIDQSAESRDYQEVLEKQILKVNYKSFCQVVVLGSASYVPFMQLPTGQRREIIEDLLDLQVFTSMNALLKDRVYFNSERVRTAENEKKLVMEKIKLVKRHSAERAESDRKLIEDREQTIESTQKQIDDSLIKKQELLREIEDLFVKMGDENTATTSVRKINRLKQELELKVESLNKDVKFFADNTTCPTCSQEIDPQFRENHVHEKKDKVKQIQDSMPELQKKLSEAQSILDEAVKIRRSANDLKLKVATIDSQVQTYKDYIARTQREIDDIKNRVPVKGEDDLQSLENKQVELESQLRDLMDNAAVLNLTGLMLKDGGIKSKIVKQYVPIMNKFINKYLSALDFFVNFELDENFEETIKSRHRDEFSYESFSEGEKMRLNLAILFAWRAVAKLRNSINTNILVLDEVFDSSLDVNGTDEFMKMLNGLTSDTNTFIISHKTDSLTDKFENILRFTKHKNFSKLSKLIA